MQESCLFNNRAPVQSILHKLVLPKTELAKKLSSLKYFETNQLCFMHMQANFNHQDRPSEESIVEIIEHIYLCLEHIARHEARNFSDAGKANLRRAQGGLQKLRLILLDKNKGGGK